MAQANSQSEQQGGSRMQVPGGGSPLRDDEEFHLNNGLCLRVKSGDITQLKGDAVVAGEDNYFSGDGGVATALLTAGGKKYAKERKKMIDKVSRLRKKGFVYFSSTGGGLQYKYVFHAVTVVRSDRGPSQKNDLKEVYHSLAKVAEDHQIAVTVTPLLGTGHEGRPMEESLQAAVDGLSRIRPKSLREVVIVEFKEEKASEIKVRLRSILEAAATGKQGQPRPGRGGRTPGGGQPQSGSPSPAGAAGQGGRGGKPPGGFRQGAIHGGSGSASGSDAKDGLQTSQAHAGMGSSTREGNPWKDTRGGQYPQGIVKKNIKKYGGGPQTTNTPHSSTTQPTMTYAQATAGGSKRKGEPVKTVNPSPCPRNGDRTRPGGGPGGQRGRGGRGRGQWEDPPPDHRDCHVTGNATHAAPSDREEVPTEPDTPPESASKSLNIVNMDEFDDGSSSDEEERTDNSHINGSAVKTETRSSPAGWSGEMHGLGEEDSHTESTEPWGSDPPGNLPQQVQTWSSSSLPDNQNEPPSTPVTPVPPPRTRRSRAQRPQRNDNDHDDDNHDSGPDNEDRRCPERRGSQVKLCKQDDEAYGGSPRGHDAPPERPGEQGAAKAEQLKPREPRCVGGGSEPEGKMLANKKPDLALQGFSGCGTILIEYSFPNGIQRPHHPAPGQPYKGTFRRAYLPDNQEGRRVLDLLQKAFDSKFTFQLVQSGPDQEWGVEFADIPHKTSLRGGQNGHGYPDQDYLQKVTSILSGHGLK